MDFRAFEATPGISVIVLPDAPHYTHVAVSHDFIRAAGIKREDVIGKGHFEVFPKSPDDPNFTGEQNLRASFEYIIENKEPHEISVQRFDIPNGDGTFRQKYWKINNAPILSDTGEVLYIIHSASDITDHVVAEQTVKSIQGFEKAYQFFMAAPVSVGFVRGKDYIIELANEGLLEVWGRGPEVIGQPLTKVIPELEQQGFIQLLDQVCTTGEPFYAYEYPITLNRHGKEEVLYFDFVYKPFYENGSESKASGVISVGHDVTAQVLAKKKIEEARQELQFVMDVMPQMVWLTRPDGYHYNYNKQWYDYTGLTYGETEGEGWNHVFHPDDQQRAWKVWRQSLATGEPYEIEYRCRRFDGAYRWFLGRALPLRDESGAILKWFGTCTDIHDQKTASEVLQQSQARTRLAVEAAHLGTFELNVAEQTIVHSPRAAEIIGLDGTRQWPYQAFKDALHPEDRSIRLKAHEEAEQTGKLFYEARFLHTDQSIRWLRLTGTLLQQDSTSVIIGTVMDITEERKASELLEQKVEERTRELQQVNEQLKQFTYAASHDLQEPLRKISYFVDRLVLNLGQSLSKENKLITDRLQLTTGRMRTLIDDLLHYSNAAMGVTSFVDVDLNAVISEVLDDMEATLIEKGADVNVQKLPTVKGDQRQLRQLFQNLISNAIKYHRKGEAPQVQITSRMVQGNEVEADLPQISND